MLLHERVEQAAWELSPSLLLLIEGRDVDGGVPDSPQWRAIVASLTQA